MPYLFADVGKMVTGQENSYQSGNSERYHFDSTVKKTYPREVTSTLPFANMFLFKTGVA